MIWYYNKTQAESQQWNLWCKRKVNSIINLRNWLYFSCQCSWLENLLQFSCLSPIYFSDTEQGNEIDLNLYLRITLMSNSQFHMARWLQIYTFAWIKDYSIIKIPVKQGWPISIPVVKLPVPKVATHLGLLRQFCLCYYQYPLVLLKVLIWLYINS